jgi:hypothetical protein
MSEEQQNPEVPREVPPVVIPPQFHVDDMLPIIKGDVPHDHFVDISMPNLNEKLGQ